MEINPADIARAYREAVGQVIRASNLEIKLVGILAVDAQDAQLYSKFMNSGCVSVGVKYEERRIAPKDVEAEIIRINEDPNVTAAIVYYPIFGDQRDVALRGVVSPFKDVEGLHPFWLEKLYANCRYIDTALGEVKSLLPCTPLAIVKILEALEVYQTEAITTKKLSGKIVSIFNRSEVVGRPLAHMLSNDGARVFSFDVNGVLEFAPGSEELPVSISREEALSMSHVVITGVPSSNFDKISANELASGSVGINFSSIENFEYGIADAIDKYIPRVGPVTVAMSLRNALRIRQDYAAQA